MNLNSSLNTSENLDTVLELLVHEVFPVGGSRKRQVSAIIAHLNSLLELPEDEKKTFLQELEEIFDPENDDVEKDAATFCAGLKELCVKHQKKATFSPSVSPIKSINFDKEFSPLKRESSPRSLSDSETSFCSSPSADNYVEFNRLFEECSDLKSCLQRLEDRNKGLITQLSNSEFRNTELENHCKDLENWKTRYEQSNKLQLENMNSDSAIKEVKIKELEKQITQLKNELAHVKNLNSELEFSKESEIVGLKSEIEELQNHAEKIHLENLEYSENLDCKELQIELLKSQSDATRLEVDHLLGVVGYLKSENKTLAEAMKEVFMSKLPSFYDSSDEDEIEPMCLKDELGGSLPTLDASTDLDDSAVFSTCAAKADIRSSAAPLLLTEKATLIVTKEAPLLVTEEAPLPVTEERTLSFTEEAPLPVTEERTLSFTEEAPLIVTEEAPPIVTEETPTIVTAERSLSMTDESSHLVLLPWNEPLNNQTRSDYESEWKALIADFKNENADLKYENADLKYENADLKIKNADLKNLIAEGRMPSWKHLSKWNVFLAIVGYLLHNAIFGYMVVFFVVILVSPYLNFNDLVRERPWLVTVGEGSLWSRPV